MQKILVENYLQFLYTDKRSDAKEWQGPNIPYGDDSNRPNLIRKCMTLESDKMKINCLRKLRDQVAMNPFYQARLDRFVDAITGIYEPTNEPGTIPGNEFKSPIFESYLQELFGKKKSKEEPRTFENSSVQHFRKKLASINKEMKQAITKCGNNKCCRYKTEDKYLRSTIMIIRAIRIKCRNAGNDKCAKEMATKFLKLDRRLQTLEGLIKKAGC